MDGNTERGLRQQAAEFGMKGVCKVEELGKGVLPSVGGTMGEMGIL
jgi:hypothetical protein